MVWNDLAKHGLTQLPQKMVHFKSDALDSHLLIDVVLDLLNRYDSCSSDFDLFFTSTAQLYSLLYFLVQLFCILHNFILIQNLRNSIISKHSNLLDVNKFSQTLSFIPSPYPCYKNLCTLVEMNLMTSIYLMVLEVWELSSQNIDQLHTRFVCFLHDRCERSIEPVESLRAYLSD